MALTSRTLSDLATLSRGVECIAAVTNPGFVDNRFSRALRALEDLANRHGIAIAIVGGLGAIHWGYPAATQDIDIAIGRDDLDRLVAHAPDSGFRVAWHAESGWHTLEYGDVEINSVPEGGHARPDSPTALPSPHEMGGPHGLGYASLPSWIELKISSGRQKDAAHVVEVLKKTTPADVTAVRSHLERVHASYVVRFEELAEQARLELEQERPRGGDR